MRYLLWDGLNVMEERNSDGTLYARYTYGYSPIYGIGSCVEVFVPGSPDKTYTLVMDHRGTAYVLLDESGAEVGRRFYDAFGVLLGQTGSWPLDLGYQANWLTVHIGAKWWALSAARLYDFATGRFTQRDSVDHHRGGHGMYEYAANAPARYVDPVGLELFIPDDDATRGDKSERCKESNESTSQLRSRNTTNKRS